MPWDWLAPPVLAEAIWPPNHMSPGTSPSMANTPHAPLTSTGNGTVARVVASKAFSLAWGMTGSRKSSWWPPTKTVLPTTLTAWMLPVARNWWSNSFGAPTVPL